MIVWKRGCIFNEFVLATGYRGTILEWGGHLFTLDACTECYEQEL